MQIIGLEGMQLLELKAFQYDRLKELGQLQSLVRRVDEMIKKKESEQVGNQPIPEETKQKNVQDKKSRS